MASPREYVYKPEWPENKLKWSGLRYSCNSFIASEFHSGDSWVRRSRIRDGLRQLLRILNEDQNEFSSLEDLELNLTTAHRLSGIIAIDGFMTSGKTTLAKFLSDKLSYPYLDLDCYCNKNSGSYMQSLRMNEVRQFIDEKNSNLLIAGVCILDVLDNLGLSPNLCIYVKRCGPSGWYEGDYADEDDLPSQSLAKSIGMSQRSIALETEIESYHRNRTPDRLAKIVFNRYES